ncbi:MAG: peptide chain release factor N(5)-glutamine methyltransferase, partial [Cyclobacteriaceae bacterium]|nr:peptide chain release factor N(5)-glutamine methyltransferase [Cyclobacteriaceae bacterium]
LEIGTGSGCIPITLQLLYPKANVYATDISEDALHVARANAREWKAVVNFIRHDILTEEIPFTSLDLIGSNPPYIAPAEEHTLADNVRKHEPHLALFAVGEDPLIFYLNIARKAKKALRPAGYVVVEINERFGEETAEIFRHEGYSDIRIVRDVSGKQRIVTATWKPS